MSVTGGRATSHRLRDESWHLCHELGLESEDPGKDPELYALIGRSSQPRYFEPVVVEFLRQVRVHDGALTLPETEDGRFVVTIPGCTKHLETLHSGPLGDAVRSMIERGELPTQTDLFNAGFDVFSIPTLEWPRPEQRYVSDVERLRKAITVERLERRTTCAE